jgi:hypothetical protein
LACGGCEIALYDHVVVVPVTAAIFGISVFEIVVDCPRQSPASIPDLQSSVSTLSASASPV